MVHSALVRVAAVLVAAGLAGLSPWLEAPHAEAAHHRCQCARGAGHHDCDCPLCAAEAARAASPTPKGAKAPPCHLARPQKSEAAGRDAAARRLAGWPVLSSSCGTGDQRIDPPPAVQHFTVPKAPALAVHVTVAVLDERLGADVGLPVEPETPPPKLG